MSIQIRLLHAFERFEETGRRAPEPCEDVFARGAGA